MDTATTTRLMEITTPLGEDVLLFHAHERARSWAGCANTSSIS